MYAGNLLEFIDHVETAPSARPPRRIRGISDGLKFQKNKTRQNKASFKKPCLRHVKNASVDYDACVQQFSIQLQVLVFRSVSL